MTDKPPNYETYRPLVDAALAKINAPTPPAMTDEEAAVLARVRDIMGKCMETGDCLNLTRLHDLVADEAGSLDWPDAMFLSSDDDAMTSRSTASSRRYVSACAKVTSRGILRPSC